MFKRVAKRQRRQEQDEAMGLDAETKEVLGLHDTDSDESSSSSNSDSESEIGDDSAAEDLGAVDEEGDEDEDAQEDGSDEDESGGTDDESEVSGDEAPPISIQAALNDPLYIISLEPDIRACITCPGKLLKNSTMCEVHRSSNAHVRRFKRFAELARQAEPETDVREVVVQLSVVPEKEKEKEASDGLSKRAAKRQAKQAKIKAKRAKQKTMKAKGVAWKKEKASKTQSPALASESESEEEERPVITSPPMKKRKLEADSARSASPDAQPRRSKGSTRVSAPAHAPTNTTDIFPKTKKSKTERERPTQKAGAKQGPKKPSNASSRPSKPLKSRQSANASQPPSRSFKGTKLPPDGKKRKRPQMEAV
ncbi:hypothetical protein FOMPIDRAFT_1062392 [Fomitopsis schrenkii]|uniref:Uncharacterized protein n=1 Tax=Fomitopsis schrenkii TaxID=2126942 RepID=S8DS96_FOMSC|nr:hypothetical protein FOMPIDRAFT_1062392 [Fomitopsis schrenkii]